VVRSGGEEDIVLSERPNAAHDAATVRAHPDRSGGGAADPMERETPTPATLLTLVRTSLEDDKAEDLVEIDLSQRSEIADTMVIASGRSSRHVGAIAEKLQDRLKSRFGMSVRTEGKEAADWVLIDCGDVIVHIFRPEVRAFYQLEKMWLPPAAVAERARESV